MSLNEQFPTDPTVLAVHSNQSLPQLDTDLQMDTDQAQAEPVGGSVNTEPAGMPTMVDLDSLAESLDQVDNTLAELDQSTIAS